LLNGWLLLKDVLRGVFGGIKGNENWRKRYNEELIKLFGELDIPSCIRIRRMNWIDQV